MSARADLRLAAAALVGCALSLGCALPTSETTALPQPSRARFAEESGPILAGRCGDFACHGTPERPFALYAVGRRRMAPADAIAREPLREAEIDANWRATLGFLDAPRGRDTTLVRKALGIGGPGGHAGGAVFEAQSDPECRAIIAWIEGPG